MVKLADRIEKGFAKPKRVQEVRLVLYELLNKSINFIH